MQRADAEAHKTAQQEASHKTGVRVWRASGCSAASIKSGGARRKPGPPKETASQGLSHKNAQVGESYQLDHFPGTE